MRVDLKCLKLLFTNLRRFPSEDISHKKRIKEFYSYENESEDCQLRQIRELKDLVDPSVENIQDFLPELPVTAVPVFLELEREQCISELGFIKSQTLDCVDLVLGCILDNVIDECAEKISTGHLKEINRKHSERLNSEELQTCCLQYFSLENTQPVYQTLPTHIFLDTFAENYSAESMENMNEVLDITEAFCSEDNLSEPCDSRRGGENEPRLQHEGERQKVSGEKI